MYDCLEDPVIRNCELTGYPDGKEPDYPICPECNTECSTIYKNQMNEVVGCEDCVEYKFNDDEIACPECEAENPECLFFKDGKIIGCDCCITEHDAWEEKARDRELARWDY